jgi:superfamily II DNA or RNA helicase
MIPSWLSAEALHSGGPWGLVKAIERLLRHAGFDDVRVIDGSGDMGADILAVRGNEEWVVQCKWSKSGPIGADGVEEVASAYATYTADRAILATNAALTRVAGKRAGELTGVGVRLTVWNGATLAKLGEQMAEFVSPQRQPREYQTHACQALAHDLEQRGSALLMLATGLGKTFVGGEVIADFLRAKPDARVLVVCHLKELSAQLERAMWKHLPKSVPTQLLTGDSKPATLDGLTAATIESAVGAVYEGYRPDLIMIDEAHHVGAEGRYRELLSLLPGTRFFGVTATPWRGDEFDLTHVFGAPSFMLGIAEGMRLGYLSNVDYRLLVDNFNWEWIREQSANGYSIKELNSRLFLPQRDVEIITMFRESWNSVLTPRAILFCQSIEHAESIASQLQASDPAWNRAKALHSGMAMQERQKILNEFRLGRTPILTSVDVLNEGVDVPDVNLIAFLRVTHSRRIFIQQLGRGLRVSQDKEKLVVLDFVTDIRRVAAALQLRRDLSGNREDLLLDPRFAESIQFSDATAGTFLDHWIRDAADLETAADDVRLQFPDENH